MSGSKLKQLWDKEWFQTALAIVLIIIVVFGFWFGLRYALNTDYPMLAVASGSMSTEDHGSETTWQTLFYVFTPTLHTGDLIIVQAVKAQDIYVPPFNESGRSGDILVFHIPNSDELIVHRAISIFPNGTIKTQGDGNSVPGPPQDGNISPNDVVGKVVMRIPLVGYLALFMRDQAGIYLILAVVIVIVAVELILSTISDKKTETPEDSIADNPSET